MAHQGYGFCEFLTEEDAEYACKIMNQIKLWGKPIRVNKVTLFSLKLKVSLPSNECLGYYRHRPTRSNLTLEQISSLEISTSL